MRVERLATALHAPRLGFRTRLSLALGLVALLVVVIAGTSLFGLHRLRIESHQAIAVDGQLSRLSSQIAIKSLQSRRFEKDFLLNIANTTALTHLERWRLANTDLHAAIDDYTKVALNADKRQATTWRNLLQNYEAGITRLEEKIADGSVNNSLAALSSFADYQISMSLLADQAVDLADQKNQAAQAAGMRLAEANQQSFMLVSVLTALTVVIALAWCVFFPARVTRPLVALYGAAQRLAAGDFNTRLRLERDDEFGILAQSFDHMAAAIQQKTADLQAQHAAAEAARAEAEAAHAQIVEQLATIEAQQSMIRDMSVPILPLDETTLVMPLIGALDTARLVLAQDAALHALERTRARSLILDVTGVPIIDTQVAQGLIQIVTAARLIGARVMIVGIRPEVAQAIVSLGVDLGAFQTFSSLQSGIHAVGKRSVAHVQASM